MFYILISVLAGVSVVVSRIINSNLAKIIGIFQGTFLNYVIGLIFSLMFLFISKETIQISNLQSKSIPLWAYLGGLLGVLVIVLSSYVTPKIFAFYLTLLIFIGQLFFGVIIDFFTLEKLSLGKIIGGILVLCGLSYNLMLDKKRN